jgi:hypothetical protein
MYHSGAAVARVHGDPRDSVINAEFLLHLRAAKLADKIDQYARWLSRVPLCHVPVLQRPERSGEPAKLAIGQSLNASRRALILSPSVWLL